METQRQVGGAARQSPDSLAPEELPGASPEAARGSRSRGTVGVAVIVAAAAAVVWQLATPRQTPPSAATAGRVLLAGRDAGPPRAPEMVLAVPVGAIPVRRDGEALSSTEVGDFDHGVADAAMHDAAHRAAACLDPRDPRRSLAVAVTFEPSGTASDVVLEGKAFEQSDVEPCILEAFAETRVPAFRGPIVTVHGFGTFR